MPPPATLIGAAVPFAGSHPTQTFPDVGAAMPPGAEADITGGGSGAAAGSGIPATGGGGGAMGETVAGTAYVPVAAPHRSQWSSGFTRPPGGSWGGGGTLIPFARRSAHWHW